MLIPFAEYRPDVSLLNSKFTDDVLNVLPADGSYIPSPSLEPLTDSLGARPLGGFRARELDGTITIFAATATKLYKLDNTDLSWTDVSGAVYNATSTAPWCFTQFGSNVVAVNQNDDPQVFDLDSDTTFSALAGSPPRAGVVRVWGDFLVLMQLTSNLDRVHWSALNDITGWTPGTANSDYQTFPDGGVVQGSNEQTNPIIFQEKAIRRGTFVPGSVEIFTFQKIHDLRGAKSAKSIAYRGAYAFYADEGGFFQIAPDGSLGNIGFEKVDRTFFSALAAADIANIHGAVDPFYSRVYWALDLAGTGIYDTMLVYDWNLTRWSRLNITTQGVFPLATTGYTLEGLDSVSSSLDALPFSLDAKVWQGGAPVLGAFDADNKIGVFSGDSMEAVITTQETGDPAGQMIRVSSVYAIVDTSDVHVSYGIRIRRTDSVTWLPEQIPSANTGRVMKNARTRFLRLRTRIPAGTAWEHAQGVDIASQPAGFR